MMLSHLQAEALTVLTRVTTARGIKRPMTTSSSSLSLMTLLVLAVLLESRAGGAEASYEREAGELISYGEAGGEE